MKTMLTIFTVVALAGASQLNAAIADRDILYTTEGKEWPVIVVQERFDRLYYKSHPTAPQNQDMRWSQVVSITYNGMNDDGFYKAGLDELAAGNYQAAAVRFDGLVNSATREWETAYGLVNKGEALELAEQWNEAAATYAAFVEALPEHRWYSDMLYRQGLALSRAGDSAGAQALADMLEARYKDPEIRDRSSQTRAFAVRTAAAAMAGDMSEATAQSRRVSLTERDGATYYHWTEFWAGLLMQEEEFAEAAGVYERVLESGNVDPSRAAGLALGMGLALAQDDEPDQALAVLTRLDALPYGSPNQRLEARFWIGKLMFETASERLGSDRDQVVEFAQQQIDDARQMLTGVIDSVISHPVKDQARDVLAQFPAQADEASSE